MMRMSGTGLYPPLVPGVRGEHVDGAVDSGAVRDGPSQCRGRGPPWPRYACRNGTDAKQMSQGRCGGVAVDSVYARSLVGGRGTPAVHQGL